MKNFKRILTSFMLIFSIILLTACGGEKSKTYYMSENGSEMTVKVKYKDDVVNELDIDAKMSYKSLDVENQEQAKLLFSMIKSMGASLEGIKFDVEYGNNEATLKVNIDLNKVNPEKLKALAGSFGGKVSEKSSGELEKGLNKIKNFKELEKSLLEAGFKEK